MKKTKKSKVVKLNKNADLAIRKKMKKNIGKADSCLLIFYDKSKDEVHYVRDNLSNGDSIAYLEVVKQKILNQVVVNEDD